MRSVNYAIIGKCIIGLALCVGIGPSAYAREGTFVTFDAPGAGTEGFTGTYPLSINPAGAITGFYQENANYFGHGFLRTPDGTITTFDPPGSFGTSAHAINPAGVITGDYFDASFVDHGFVRASDGTFTTFDVPGVFLFGTGGGIDPAGTVTGSYLDANFVVHGFLRAPDGTITTIDAPGAGAGAFPSGGTWAFGINPQGTVAGCYIDNSNVGHGFVRNRKGTLTAFDVPDSTNLSCAGDYGELPFGSSIVGINPAGAITGAAFEPSENLLGGNYRGFLRGKDGTFTTFDAVPSPSSPCCTWTFGIAINPAGVIAGYDNDFESVNHGFVRATDGTVTILDAPGAGTGSLQGTIALAINPAGQVTGEYADENSGQHGFLWTPWCKGGERGPGNK